MHDLLRVRETYPLTAKALVIRITLTPRGDTGDHSVGSNLINSDPLAKERIVQTSLRIILSGQSKPKSDPAKFCNRSKEVAKNIFIQKLRVVKWVSRLSFTSHFPLKTILKWCAMRTEWRDSKKYSIVQYPWCFRRDVIEGPRGRFGLQLLSSLCICRR